MINEDVDLHTMAKRLTERGAEPYIDNEVDRSKVGQSPLLLEISQTILAKVESYFNEQFVLSLDSKIVSILNTERNNFSMRLNLLFTWATLILHEISDQAFQVFDVLDDWVVIAVKCENQSCQNAVKEIQGAVEENELHIDTILIQNTDLRKQIDTIEFYDGPPSYMAEAKPDYSIQASRSSLDSLSLIYRQLRAHQEDTNLIDIQTFLSLTLLNIQQEVLPNVWRYVSFENLEALAERFVAKPLTDSPNGDQVQMFRRRSVEGNNQDRKFMDWRKAFVVLALMAGKIPSGEQKQAYFNNLRAKQTICEGGILTKEAFVKINAWFDKCESAEVQKPLEMPGMVGSASQGRSMGIFSARSLSMVSPAASDKQIAKLDESVEEEDDDDGGDQERLEAVKGFLFETYRVQNHVGIMLDDYVADLDFVFKEVATSQIDERTLYQTLLNMRM